MAATAPGPYDYTTANRGDVIVGEDPTLWQDARGHWHMVFEHYIGASCGNHAFSAAGTDEWVIVPSIYSVDVVRTHTHAAPTACGCMRVACERTCC